MALRVRRGNRSIGAMKTIPWLRQGTIWRPAEKGWERKKRIVRKATGEWIRAAAIWGEKAKVANGGKKGFVWRLHANSPQWETCEEKKGEK